MSYYQIRKITSHELYSETGERLDYCGFCKGLVLYDSLNHNKACVRCTKLALRILR